MAGSQRCTREGEEPGWIVPVIKAFPKYSALGASPKGGQRQQKGRASAEVCLCWVSLLLVSTSTVMLQ